MAQLGTALDLHGDLSGLDYAAIASYFALVLATGYYFSRRQHDTQEYFVAGRNMPSWAVGLSIFATVLSTISYLSVPGEILKHGVAVTCGVLAYPLLFLLIGYLVIPYFMRHRATSAYEFLERRFDLKTRLFAGSLFVLIRLSWMGVIVFTASLALANIIGMSSRHIWVLSLSIGVVAIAYTTLGGMRAVIWTDVLQFFILTSGVLFTVFYIALATGTGPLAWWQSVTTATAEQTGQPLWSWDPFTRASYGGMVVSAFFWWICTASSDQVTIQRFFSTPSTGAARRAFAINLLGDTLVMILLALCGMALLSYYRGGLPDKPDEVFPHFIRHGLPRGLAGLLVAALFSAAMSSLDSGMNSISTVLTTDFYRRLRREEPDPRTELRLAQIATLITGCVAVSICVLVSWVSAEKRGNILDLASQINTFIVGSLGGLFFIAIFLRRSSGSMAIASTMVGMAVGFVLALGHWLPFLDLGIDELGNPRKFSWMWVIPSSCLVTLILGWLLPQLLRNGGRKVDDGWGDRLLQ